MTGRLWKNYLDRQEQRVGRDEEGFLVRGSRKFEPAFLACSQASRTTNCATDDFISNLLGWEKRAPAEDSLGTAEILAGL